MFRQLPQELQDTLLNYLQSNDFPMAKQLYDGWLATQVKESNQLQSLAAE